MIMIRAGRAGIESCIYLRSTLHCGHNRGGHIGKGCWSADSLEQSIPAKLGRHHAINPPQRRRRRRLVRLKQNLKISVGKESLALSDNFKEELSSARRTNGSSTQAHFRGYSPEGSVSVWFLLATLSLSLPLPAPPLQSA